jgi:hypothetical protein
MKKKFSSWKSFLDFVEKNGAEWRKVVTPAGIKGMNRPAVNMAISRGHLDAAFISDGGFLRAVLIPEYSVNAYKSRSRVAMRQQSELFSGWRRRERFVRKGGVYWWAAMKLVRWLSALGCQGAAEWVGLRSGLHERLLKYLDEIGAPEPHLEA